MMAYITAMLIVVVGYFICQTYEYPTSSKNQKLKCNIKKDFIEIYNGRRCTNFENFGKFNDDVYGIEIVSDSTVKQWKINSKEFTYSEVNMQDQLVKKVIEHHLNETDVWVVFQSGSEYFLSHWNLATPLKTKLWPLTGEMLSDFGFHNSSLLVLDAKFNELFITKYKLDVEKEISVMIDETKVITMEHEARKVQISNTEIIMEDVNYQVVKVNYRNLLKFFNESEAALNSEVKTPSTIPFCVGILIGSIGGGFIGALILYRYLKTQYKLIKKPKAEKPQKPQKNERKRKSRKSPGNENSENERLKDPKNENGEETEGTEMNNLSKSKTENRTEDSKPNPLTTNTEANNSSSKENNVENTDDSKSCENHGMHFNDNESDSQSESDETPNDPKKPKLATTATQTSEKEKSEINLSDIELCPDSIKCILR